MFHNVITTAVDYCHDDPCVNGICINGITNYTCNCIGGYMGTNCSKGIYDMNFEIIFGEFNNPNLSYHKPFENLAYLHSTVSFLPI